MEEFVYVGESPALDFVNTESVESDRRRDGLSGFGALVSWSVGAGLISAAEASALSAFDGTVEGESALHCARELRAQLRAALQLLAAGERIDERAVPLVNALLNSCAGHLALEVADAGAPFRLRYTMSLSDPMQLVAHIAENAAQLLCSPASSHIKKCENPACVLMFLDVSKNKKRRWCSMAMCGNRHKVASHRRRKEQEQAKSGI